MKQNIKLDIGTLKSMISDAKSGASVVAQVTEIHRQMTAMDLGVTPDLHINASDDELIQSVWDRLGYTPDKPKPKPTSKSDLIRASMTIQGAHQNAHWRTLYHNESPQVDSDIDLLAQQRYAQYLKDKGVLSEDEFEQKYAEQQAMLDELLKGAEQVDDKTFGEKELTYGDLVDMFNNDATQLDAEQLEMLYTVSFQMGNVDMTRRVLQYTGSSEFEINKTIIALQEAKENAELGIELSQDEQQNLDSVKQSVKDKFSGTSINVK